MVARIFFGASSEMPSQAGDYMRALKQRLGCTLCYVYGLGTSGIFHFGIGIESAPESYLASRSHLKCWTPHLVMPHIGNAKDLIDGMWDGYACAEFAQKNKFSQFTRSAERFSGDEITEYKVNAVGDIEQLHHRLQRSGLIVSHTMQCSRYS